MDDAKKALFFRLMECFAAMKCNYQTQMQMISASIGEAKQVTKLEIHELKKILYDITGEEATA